MRLHPCMRLSWLLIGTLLAFGCAASEQGLAGAIDREPTAAVANPVGAPVLPVPDENLLDDLESHLESLGSAEPDVAGAYPHGRLPTKVVEQVLGYAVMNDFLDRNAELFLIVETLDFLATRGVDREHIAAALFPFTYDERKKVARTATAFLDAGGLLAADDHQAGTFAPLRGQMPFVVRYCRRSTQQEQRHLPDIVLEHMFANDPWSAARTVAWTAPLEPSDRTLAFRQLSKLAAAFATRDGYREQLIELAGSPLWFVRAVIPSAWAADAGIDMPAAVRSLADDANPLVRQEFRRAFGAVDLTDPSVKSD